MIVETKITHIYEIDDPIIQKLVFEFKEWSAEQGRSPEEIDSFDFPLALEGELKWWAEKFNVICQQNNIEVPEYFKEIISDEEAAMRKYLFT